MSEPRDDEFTGVGVPRLQEIAPAECGNPAPVRGKACIENRQIVRNRPDQRLAARKVPNVHRIVPALGHEPVSFRTPGDRLHPVTMLQRRRKRLASRQIQKVDVLVIAGGRQNTIIRTERGPIDPLMGDWEAQFSGNRVPHPR